MKSYPFWHWMITLRTFFIDLITFAKAFDPPSGLFELNLGWCPPFYLKYSSNFKIIASVLLASCETKLPLLNLISYLRKMNIFTTKSSLPVIPMNDLFVSFDGIFAITRFWLDFWKHLYLVKLKCREKERLTGLENFSWGFFYLWLIW